jgi:hypothetical protein
MVDQCHTKDYAHDADEKLSSRLSLGTSIIHLIRWCYAEKDDLEVPLFIIKSKLLTWLSQYALVVKQKGRRKITIGQNDVDLRRCYIQYLLDTFPLPSDPFFL